MRRFSFISYSCLTAAVLGLMSAPAGAATSTAKKPTAKATSAAKPAAKSTSKPTTTTSKPAASKTATKTVPKSSPGASKPASKATASSKTPSKTPSASKSTAKTVAKPAAKPVKPTTPAKKEVSSATSTRKSTANAASKPRSTTSDKTPEKKPAASVARSTSKGATVTEKATPRPPAKISTDTDTVAKKAPTEPTRLTLPAAIRGAGEPERPAVDVPELNIAPGVLTRAEGADEPTTTAALLIGGSSGSAVRLPLGLEPTVDVSIPAAVAAMPPVELLATSDATPAPSVPDAPPAPDEPMLFGEAETVQASVRDRASAIESVEADGAGARPVRPAVEMVSVARVIRALPADEPAEEVAKETLPAAAAKARVELAKLDVPADVKAKAKSVAGTVLTAAKQALPEAADLVEDAISLEDIEPVPQDEMAPKPALRRTTDPLPQAGAMGDLMIAANSQTDFSTDQNRVVFAGSVVMRNERFYLTADKLVVYMKPNQGGLDFAEAQGNVTVKLVEDGHETGAAGQSNVAVYQPKTGEIKLRGWPKLRLNDKAHIASSATTEMSLFTDGRMTTSGRNQTVFTPASAAGTSSAQAPVAPALPVR